MIRVENPALWRRYFVRREAIRREVEAVAVDKVQVEAHGQMVDERINECHLFHGSSAIDMIVHGGMKQWHSNKGALNAAHYGLYFGDCFSKSNNYTACEQCHSPRCDGCAERDWQFRLLLCRVTLGKAQGVSDKDRTLTSPVDGLHSVVAYQKEVNSSATFAFSEFVVYDNAQAYPQYIIYYRRRSQQRPIDKSEVCFPTPPTPPPK